MKEYRRKKEEGVSPVIATILMVAITVVLAATLYLMVGNMNTGGTSNAHVGLSAVISKDGTNATVTVSSITGGTVPLNSIGVKVIKTDGSIATVTVTLHKANGTKTTFGSGATGTLAGAMYFTFRYDSSYSTFQLYNNKGVLGEADLS